MRERITKSDDLDISSIERMIFGHDAFNEYHSFYPKNLQDVSKENKFQISIENGTKESEHYWKTEIMRKFMEVR